MKRKFPHSPLRHVWFTKNICHIFASVKSSLTRRGPVWMECPDDGKAQNDYREWGE